MAEERSNDHEFPAAGEWGCYRRDGSQQARSPLKGRITAPKIAWKHFVSVIETLVEIQPDGKDTRVSAPMKDTKESSAVLNDQRWGLGPILGTIEGREQPVNRTSQITYADVLPEAPGLEKIEFESGFRESGVDGNWPPSSGWLMAWKNGRWEKIWQMAPCNLLFNAYPLVGDFDADGKLEIAFLPWRELVILDALTGQVKDRCQFTEGRSYGFFGVYDMNGDGQKQFLVMADFSKHVDVLGYRNGKLSVLWRMDIEQDISNPQKVMRVNCDPAADVDGDGKLEVMLNLQNGKGDGRWYVTVYDGMSGKIKAEIADARLQGIADIDGDGAAELLVMTTNGAMIPEYGTLRVWRLKDCRPSVIWEQKNAAWQLWERPIPPHVYPGIVDGRRDALWRKAGGKLPVIVIRRPVEGKSGVVSVSAEAWRDGALRTQATITGPDIEGLGLDENGNMLVGCWTAPASAVQLVVSSGRGTALVSSEKGMRIGPVAVVRDVHFKRPVVVAAGHEEQLVVFHPPQGHGPVKELRRVRGRPQQDGISQLHRGPVMADLLGNGQRQLIYALAATEGYGRLVAMSLDGKELWGHDIPRISVERPTWNVCGLILWQVGHFRAKDRMDVLLTIRRSMMHSEETMLLAGEDGREIWRRDRQILSRAVGGTPFAIADCDGDGLDDVVSLHPNVYYILKGTTGENLLAHQTHYWGQPIAGDFLNNGTISIFFGTNRGAATGVLTAKDTEAKGLWWDAINSSAWVLPAFGDFSGGGRMEAVGIGYPDGIRCYDTATGQVKWRMPAPAEGKVTDTVASADVDSDGRDEALFVIGHTLYCIGADKEGKAGILEWKLDLPAAAGAPVVADADGDGLAEILVSGADGYVYCVE